MFSGSIPALVTPFCDGAFSEKHYRALIDWQIEQGSSALVPAGTTGEASTLLAVFQSSQAAGRTIRPMPYFILTFQRNLALRLDW